MIYQKQKIIYSFLAVFICMLIFLSYFLDIHQLQVTLNDSKLKIHQAETETNQFPKKINKKSKFYYGSQSNYLAIFLKNVRDSDVSIIRIDHVGPSSRHQHAMHVHMRISGSFFSIIKFLNVTLKSAFPVILRNLRFQAVKGDQVQLDGDFLVYPSIVSRKNPLELDSKNIQPILTDKHFSIFENINNPQLDDHVHLNQLNFMGITFSNKKRCAIIEYPDHQLAIYQKGDIIGVERAKIIEIRPDIIRFKTISDTYPILSRF